MTTNHLKNLLRPTLNNRVECSSFSSLKRFSASHLLSLGLGSSLLFGCFDPSNEEGEENSNATPLTHEQAHQLIDSTVRNTVETLDQRLRFLDGDERLMATFNNLFSWEDASEDCWIDFDDEGNEIEMCDDFSEEDGEDERIVIDFAEGTSEMISDILTELPRNLVIDGEAQLTYQLSPSRLCEQSNEEDEWIDDEEWVGEPGDEEGAAPEEMESANLIDEPIGEEPDLEVDPDCLRVMERESPRIRIQSYGDGLQAELLVAQGQERLVSAIMTSELVKVSADLGAFSRVMTEMSADDGASEEESDLELEMSGSVSLQMDMSESNRAVFSVNVDSPISISGRVDGIEQINLTFPAAQKVFFVGSDSVTPSLNLGLAIPKLVESLQTSLSDEYEYDEETGEDRLVEEGPMREIIATLGGLDLNLNLTLVEEGIETAIEVGLGQESSSLKVDGQEIIKVDLNPDHGRLIAFDLDHSSLNEGGLLIALASELHSLKFDLKLGLLEEIGAPLGFADELYNIAFTSLAGELPSLKIGDEVFAEVLSGELKINAERADLSLNAEAGMCIDFEEDESYEESFEEVVEESSEEEQHPLEILVVNACMESGE